ncbi:MAG: NOL1/NOP2/sun family putative RNA methylase [Nanobdellota archaeon]
MENMQYKEKFRNRYEKLTHWDKFWEFSMKFLSRSIRVNTLKISVSDLKRRIQDDWHLEPVKWCPEGFFIDHKGKGDDYRRDVGNLIEHSLGYIFIQEASSMIPPRVLKPKPGEFILDMCASPGSKTTQIAQYMKNEGLLLSNDYKSQRNKALGLNVQRMGVLNALMTLKDGKYFRDFQFDRILVDAPCSGTGTIRKSPKTLKIWNPNMVKRLAITQKDLIENAFNNLKPGGTLVYSTCSLEPEEDEGVISHLLDKYPKAVTEKIELDINRSEPVMEFEGKILNEGVKNCLRIWPQDNDTDGFFVCRIRKEE